MSATPQTSIQSLLSSAGFRVREKRAECVHCSGSAKLTVSFNNEVAHCHRCKWSANRWQLAKGLGQTVSPRKIGKVEVRKKRFFAWLSLRYGQMADLERVTVRKARLALSVLEKYPDCEPAWAALANFYHVEHYLRIFFESAQDRIGRLELYRAWRAANG
jgi:hypothetical protein